MAKAKKPTVSQLKKKLDTVFSLYIRHSYATGGYCTCYTCGRELPIKEIQCGHLFSRARQSTRYVSENCRPQCFGCNVMQKGKYDEFHPRMIREIGLDEYMRLYDCSKQEHQWKTAELETLLHYYSDALTRMNV